MPNHKVGIYLDAKSHILSSSHHLAIAEESGRCVGLMAALDLVADQRFLTYIETLMVSERHHGTALAPGLIATLFGESCNN
jgi:hypothetical protein